MKRTRAVAAVEPADPHRLLRLGFRSIGLAAVERRSGPRCRLQLLDTFSIRRSYKASVFSERGVKTVAKLPGASLLPFDIGAGLMLSLYEAWTTSLC